MTPAEFLLARIADDVTDASTSHALRCDRTRPCYEEPAADPDDKLCSCRQRRVLADCYAKRRIVEHYLWASSYPDTATAQEQYDKGRLDGLRSVVEVLARIYLSHPDYVLIT